MENKNESSINTLIQKKYNGLAKFASNTKLEVPTREIAFDPLSAAISVKPIIDITARKASDTQPLEQPKDCRSYILGAKKGQTYAEDWNYFQDSLLKVFCFDSSMKVKSAFDLSVATETNDMENYKIDRGRTRLDILDENDGFMTLSSGEFVSKMGSLKQDMTRKWERADRVGTLKIVIHCTKMLNDVFTPQFYTHKFILVAGMVDLFSSSVYSRLYKLSFPGMKTKYNFSRNDVSERSISIAENWIMKTVCIRELLPRIYIEIAFLNLYRFIYADDYIEERILIISRMINGISHPLIACYVATYLVKTTINYFPEFNKHIPTLLESLSKFKIDNFEISRLGYANITSSELKKIIEPCFEWIVYSLTRSANNQMYKRIIQLFDDNQNYLLLTGLILHLPIKYLFNQKYLEYLFGIIENFSARESVAT